MARSIRQSASADQEPNGMTSLIGIDAEGSEHRYIHHRDTVRVERPDGTVDTYGCESVDAWCDVVENACGWETCHARMSLYDHIVAAISEEDA